MSEIDIGVYDPTKKDGFTKYVVYCVKGNDKNGQYEVYRRYSEFHKLRNEMLSRWPGAYIASIPPKQAVGNMKSEFIEIRRKQLEVFVQQIGKARNLYYSDEFQLFIRSNSQNFEKEINNLKKIQFQDIIVRMRMAYPDIEQKEINTELEMKISQFNMFIKKNKPMLENFLIQAKSIKNTKHQFQSQFDLFNRMMMPEYEKNCINEYNKDDIYDQLNEENDNLMPITKFNHEQQSSTNQNRLNQTDGSGFEDLETNIKNELLAMDAIQDSLKQKLEYEGLKRKNESRQKELELELQKMIAGKKTLKSWFSKTSPQDMISDTNQQIDKLKNDLESIQCICDIITVILGHIEIDRFKSNMSKQYFQMLADMGSKEKDYQKLLVSYWSQINQNPKLQFVK